MFISAIPSHLLPCSAIEPPVRSQLQLPAKPHLLKRVEQRFYGNVLVGSLHYGLNLTEMIYLREKNPDKLKRSQKHQYKNMTNVEKGKL